MHIPTFVQPLSSAAHGQALVQRAWWRGAVRCGWLRAGEAMAAGGEANVESATGGTFTSGRPAPPPNFRLKVMTELKSPHRLLFSM